MDFVLTSILPGSKQLVKIKKKDNNILEILMFLKKNTLIINK